MSLLRMVAANTLQILRVIAYLFVDFYLPSSLHEVCWFVFKDCEAGRYKDETTLTGECLACEAGRFANQSGSSSCAACVAGKQSNETKSTSADACNICGPGTFAPTPGMSACTLCMVGTYLNRPGTNELEHDEASDCVSCAPGKLSADDRASCNDCGAGTYPDPIEMECAKCGLGRYSVTGAECLDCGPGFFTNGVTSAASACLSCDAGSYSKGKSTNCSECRAGNWSSARAEECSKCERGKSSGSRSAFCNPCDSHKTSTAMASNCSLCIGGYYMDNDGVCKECPDNAECKEGTSIDNIAVKNGFYRFSNASKYVYACYVEKACRATKKTGDAICADLDARGPLCSYCQKNLYMDPIKGSCLDCRWGVSTITIAHFFTLLTVFMLLVIISVFFRGRTWRCYRQRVSKSTSWKKLEAIWGKLEHHIYAVGPLPFMYIWFLGQTTVQFTKSFPSVMYPSPFAELMAALETTVVTFTSLFPTVCIGISFYSELLITAIWWIALSSLAWFYSVANKAMNCRSNTANRSTLQLYDMSAYLLILFHSQICAVIFATFNCTVDLDVEGSLYETHRSTDRFLLADMTLSCTDDQYDEYYFFAIAAAFFYAAIIPLALLAVLRNPQKHASITRPLLFLVRELKRSAWGYEVLSMVFRFTLTGFFVIIQNESLRLVLSLLLTVTMLTITGLVKPYLNRRDNTLGCIFYLALCLVVTFTMVLHADQLSDEHDKIFGICLVLIFTVIGLIAINHLYESPLTPFQEHLKLRQPIPTELFVRLWASRRLKVLSLLLREVGHIFQVSIEQDTDKHIADSDWAYVQESILKLKDTNQSSVWDDKVPLSCLFNSNNEVSKAFTWSNDTRIDADKVHDIANEIYGATVDEGLLEGVLTEIMQSTFAEEMQDLESNRESEARLDVILTLQCLHGALINGGFIHINDEQEIACFTLLKIVAQRTFQMYRNQSQSTVRELVGDLQNTKDFSAPKEEMTQPSVAALVRFLDDITPQQPTTTTTDPPEDQPSLASIGTPDPIPLQHDTEPAGTNFPPPTPGTLEEPNAAVVCQRPTELTAEHVPNTPTPYNVTTDPYIKMQQLDLSPANHTTPNHQPAGKQTSSRPAAQQTPTLTDDGNIDMHDVYGDSELILELVAAFPTREGRQESVRITQACDLNDDDPLAAESIPTNQQIIYPPIWESSCFPNLFDKLVLPEFLRAVAMSLMCEFEGVLREICSEAGLEDGALHVAPVKQVLRMREKQRTYQNTEGLQYPFSHYLGDVLRCTYAVDDGKAMRRTTDAVYNHQCVTVLRLKNKVAKKKPPYNIHMNASFQSRKFKTPFVVEIQILHKYFYDTKDCHHRLYEIHRAKSASKV